MFFEGRSETVVNPRRVPDDHRRHSLVHQVHVLSKWALSSRTPVFSTRLPTHRPYRRKSPSVLPHDRTSHRKSLYKNLTIQILLQNHSVIKGRRKQPEKRMD